MQCYTVNSTNITELLQFCIILSTPFNRIVLPAKIPRYREYPAEQELGSLATAAVVDLVSVANQPEHLAGLPSPLALQTDGKNQHSLQWPEPKERYKLQRASFFHKGQ